MKSEHEKYEQQIQNLMYAVKGMSREQAIEKIEKLKQCGMIKITENPKVVIRPKDEQQPQ